MQLQEYSPMKMEKIKKIKSANEMKSKNNYQKKLKNLMIELIQEKKK